MSNDNKHNTMFDFSFEKDDCKAAEDNLRTTLFSNMSCQRSFKEELFNDELPVHWKSELNDFNVDELLGSYFESDLPPAPPLSSVGDSGIVSIPINPTPVGEEMSLKEEDFEPFRDFVSLPFDAVMDSLDTGFEAASDSGVSTDNIQDVMLSPSSGTTSPDPRGDISMDTLDAVSDVSSTSDLGSMESVGSSPNGGNGYTYTPIHLNLGASTPVPGDEEVEMKTLPVTLNSVLDTKNTIFTTTTTTLTRPIVTLPQSFTKHSSSSTLPSTITTQPSIATRSIKLELAHHPSSIVKPITTSTTRSPILTKVRLDTSGAITSHKITTSRTNSPQTIVMTQAGKVNPLLRNGTLLKAGTGRSILLPVNVNDLNKVRTIKIISAGSNNTSVSTSVRNLVSTVRPVSTSANISTGNRTTFYTTSKGPDGRSLLNKMTPTALVTPNAHSEVSRVNITPSYIKEEQSDDDEDTPLPNQELLLTDEERRLMRKEGLVLPSRYPLTKQEERDLKRIRRKIRNKISAQDSRKRKKEYVDGLEDRVKNCTDENQQLQKRIKHLEKQNETLLAKLKTFQNLVGGSIYHNRPHNHASTALMMLILSAALFVVPSLRNQDGKGENELTRNSKMPSAGHSRSLLEAHSSSLNIEGFPSNQDEDELDPLAFSHALSDHDYAPVAKKPRMDTQNTFFSPPSIDKTISRGAGDPPDGIGGLNSVAAMIGAMFDRLGSNWTDPGGQLGGALNRTPPHGTPERSSVVVNLNHGRRLRDDIELE